MAGYVGYSRSWNSEEAIENFEAPMSLINRSYLDAFIEESDYAAEEKAVLKKTTVKNWKAALAHVGAASWHHTSKFYNRTDHYSLADGAKVILSGEDYTPRKEETAEYGCIRVQVWGGTRTRPKMLGTKYHVGTIKGDWLTNEEGKRFKLSANKTEFVRRCKSIEEAKELVAEKDN